MANTFVRTLSFKAAPKVTTKGTFLSLCYKKPDWKYLVQDNTNGGKYHQFHFKIMIKHSPIEGSRKLTNHSVRKTLVNKLKKHQVAKSDIITITGHNNERGLDAYDSGDEEQQKHLSNCIENNTIIIMV